jgi:hypothetical protein
VHPSETELPVGPLPARTLGSDSGNALEHESQPLHNIVVREAEYAQVTAGEDRVAGLVVASLVVVDVAVYFDHEASRFTIEVGDEPVDNLLATESQTGKPPAPEFIPQDAFRRCHVGAQLASTLALRVGHALPNHDPGGARSSLHCA